MEENKNKKDKIILRKLNDLVAEKFGNYSRYIIQDRALPDINDGLKPVQRRILFAMYKLKLFSKNPYKKSARVVGDVIGKYHPHGDTSVYEAMIRMSQEWKMSIPLVDMHGNKGSIDGDSAAAMRYTEARLQELTNFLIGDIEKDIVKFNPNFDDSELEPSVFPSIFPNLLINGSTGIASGYSTNIPPHNFNEVIEGLIYILKNPEASINDIFKIIKGPDFPTGGIIESKKDILNAYKNGQGKITIKSKIHYDQKRNSLIITEIPFEVNKSSLVKKIDELINSTSITTIQEVIDETDRSGLQIAIVLKKNVNFNSVINFLFKKTDLQKKYSMNFIAIKDKSPQNFSLKEFFTTFSHFTTKNYLTLYKYELEKVNVRLEIVEGIIKALPIIDEIISIIRKSLNKADAKTKLIQKFQFSEVQAEAILNLKLYRLSSTDISELETEKSNLKVLQKHFTKALEDPIYLREQIIDVLQKLNQQFVFPRRSQIKKSTVETEEFDAKDLIKEEEVRLLITKKNTIKILSDEELIKHPKTTLDDLLIVDEKLKSFKSILIFTSHGKFYASEIFKIPKSKARDSGINISKLFNLLPDEEIIKVLFANQEDLKTENDLIIATKNSNIKKIKYSLLSSSTTKNGIKIIKLLKNDKVISYENSFDKDGIINVVTKNGFILRYPISHISISLLNSQGVQNIKLESPSDEVIGIQFQSSSTISSASKSLIYATKDAKFTKVPLITIKESSRSNKGQKIAFLEKDLEIISIFKDDEYKTIEFLNESFKAVPIIKDEIVTYKKTSKIKFLDLNQRIIYISDRSILKLVDQKNNNIKKNNLYNKEPNAFFNF